MPATTGFYPERSRRTPTHFRVQHRLGDNRIIETATNGSKIVLDSTGENMADNADWQSEAFQYSQAWFWHHAKQRYDSIQIFTHQMFIVPLFALASVIASTAEKLAPYRGWVCFGAIALSLIGAVITFLFQQLEIRNLELVKRGSNALKRFESKCDWSCTDGTSQQQLGLIRSDESGTATGQGSSFSHKKTFTCLFALAYVVHASIALVAAVVLISSCAKAP